MRKRGAHSVIAAPSLIGLRRRRRRRTAERRRREEHRRGVKLFSRCPLFRRLLASYGKQKVQFALGESSEQCAFGCLSTPPGSVRILRQSSGSNNFESTSASPKRMHHSHSRALHQLLILSAVLNDLINHKFPDMIRRRTFSLHFWLIRDE